MEEGFLLVLVAVPVCAGLVVSIGVLGIYTLAVGDPVSAGRAGGYVNLTPMEPPNSAFRQTVLGRAEEVLPALLGLE